MYAELVQLTDEEELLKETAHRFAEEVMRPAARELDRMAPAARCAPGSPYFEVMSHFRALGYHRAMLPSDGGEPDAELSARGQAVMLEELGWGSLGPPTAIGVSALPFVLVARLGAESLKEQILAQWLDDGRAPGAPELHGCWGATEPDHGSDFIDCLRDRAMASPGRAQVLAERDGDGWLLRGQKSAWVSSAPVATHCALHAQLAGGEHLEDGLLAFVPLDLPGVRKGPPVGMLGARDDPQGELFFDGVRIPADHVLVPPGPLYPIFVDQLLCMTSASIANIAVGVARAAFEEALAFACARVQGGTVIAGHKNIQLTLYSMFEKVETARCYARQALCHLRERTSGDVPLASPRHTRAAQIYAKRIAFEVANDAVQVCGAYGLSEESTVEKLFRDARSLLIEDGTLEVLALDAARDLIANYESNAYEMEGTVRP
ncbi:MAG: acyl-CoA dehydrogenase family protein [Solirubrobacteraceae bacterium]